MDAVDNMISDDEWFVVDYSYNELKSTLGKLGETMVSLEKIGHNHDVSYDPKTKQFMSTAKEVSNSWMSFISSSSLVASLSQSVSNLIGTTTTVQHITNFLDEYCAHLLLVKFYVPTLETEELQDLKTTLDQETRQILKTAQDGLLNLKNTQGDYPHGPNAGGISKTFTATLFDQVEATMKMVDATLKGRLDQNIVLDNNPLSAEQQEFVLAAFANALELESFENSEPLQLETTIIAEDESQIINELELNFEQLTRAEKKWLSTFLLNGESLKSVMDKLSHDGCYSFNRFVNAFLNERNGRGRSLQVADPCSMRLNPLRIGGEPLLKALESVPQRDYIRLGRLVDGYWVARKQRDQV